MYRHICPCIIYIHTNARAHIHIPICTYNYLYICTQRNTHTHTHHFFFSGVTEFLLFLALRYIQPEFRQAKWEHSVKVTVLSLVFKRRSTKVRGTEWGATDTVTHMRIQGDRDLLLPVVHASWFWRPHSEDPRYGAKNHLSLSSTKRYKLLQYNTAVLWSAGDEGRT